MNLTELAKGRACEIRIPGECLRNTETTVFCHVRMPTISGLGLKAPDWLGAFGCEKCHDIVDSRAGSWESFPQTLRDLYLLEGSIRTLVILVNEGVIQVPEVKARRPKLTKIFRRKIT